MRSGFTILRNGSRLGYPFRESLSSLAPFVDEIVVAHGDSDDDTLNQLERLGQILPCPVRILSSPWDPASLKGGFELSRQTNIALDACRGDICFYLQSDEVLHLDEDAELIRDDLERFENDKDVQTLAFRWVHFYGNFRTVARSRKWYRREVRVVKKSSGVRSYGDAQGFRVPTSGGEHWIKPRAALSRARVLHYGWVRPPETMAAKSVALDRLWGNEQSGKAIHKPETSYPIQYGLIPFAGKHPTLMNERVEALGDFDPFRGLKVPKNKEYWRCLTSDWMEGLSGWRPGEFRNYKLIKRY